MHKFLLILSLISLSAYADKAAITSGSSPINSVNNTDAGVATNNYLKAAQLATPISSENVNNTLQNNFVYPFIGLLVIAVGDNQTSPRGLGSIISSTQAR